MSEKKKTFLIFDGNAILHRAWHALPPMITKDGTMVNAVYGFLTIFFKSLRQFNPEFVAVTFDRKEKTFRHEMTDTYKATRVKQPDELYAQIPIIKEVLSAMNIQIFEKAGFEADDVIGTLCDSRQVNRQDVLSIIVTGDQDTLQLVDENTHVFTMRKGMSDTVVYDIVAVKEKFSGLLPNQMIDYKGLRGDPSDNISGIPGVGEKTAIGLLQEFGTIEKIYERVKVGQFKNIKISEKLYQNILDHRKEAFESKVLATIIRDVPIDFNLNACELKKYEKDVVVKLFQKLEFMSLVERLPEFGGTEQLSNGALLRSASYGRASNGATEQGALLRSTSYGRAGKEQSRGEKSFVLEKMIGRIEKDTDFEKLKNKIEKEKIFSFVLFLSDKNIFQARAEALAISCDGKEVFLIENKKLIKEFYPLFADKDIFKIGYDVKQTEKFLRLQSCPETQWNFDVMIASYLLNPGSRSHELPETAFRELGIDLLGEEKNKGQKSLLFQNDDFSEKATQSAIIFQLYENLSKQLKENDLQKLFEEMEMPLVNVLAEMELNGIKVDVEYLAELKSKTEKRIKKITEKIYELTGYEFNIASPKQLKEVLFEKLKISTVGIHKTKTGLSTASDELEKLRELHPSIEYVEEFRELSKLLSTYIEALPALIENKTGRVHTEYNQTVTATGRLSSSNPNLQNIPIRSDLGQEIRRSFIAEKGNVLISADYSQVELRVIACLAKDKNMMDIFARGEDIHTATAAKIFEVPIEQVDKEMRSAAKEVNFGVLYGMGAYGLASRKKISREKAKQFITKYFENFYEVKKYLDGLKDFALEKGYVETMFGRKRYLPEINSGVPQVRAGAERMAINMPIQGAAADLMKIAMIEVYNELKRKRSKTKMLLQVHDELVFECPRDEVKEIAKIIDEKMEKVHKLAVPIKVDTDVGDNWQEMVKMF
ncbi:MAG: DNA polymerase I [Patescibacteria group bacterium]